MSKVQTFEEWMDEKIATGGGFTSPPTQVKPRGDFFTIEERAAMRVAWQAAMENAARVCEVPMTEVLLQVGEMPRQSIRDARFVLSGRAAAIREAAKR